MNQSLFADADVIHTYTTEQAIEDGMLVDVDTLHPTMRQEAGIRVPVYMTTAAFELAVALSPAAKRACNDINGRLWDVLWMLANAARRAPGEGRIGFRMMCVTKRVRPTTITLWATMGPRCPDGAPCITVGLPGED